MHRSELCDPTQVIVSPVEELVPWRCTMVSRRVATNVPNGCGRVMSVASHIRRGAWGPPCPPKDHACPFTFASTDPTTALTAW